LVLKRIWFVFIIITLPLFAWGKGRGIVFDGALGFPSVTISNPDGVEAGYEGLSLQGRLLMPMTDPGKFGMFVYGVIRYHDLENSYSSTDATEVANHIGPGAGLMLRYGGLHLAYDYSMMKARHYYIGSIGRKAEFDYSSSNIDVGASIALQTLRVGISYAMGTAAIGKSETGMTRDADYAEQTIWLTLTYSSDLRLGDISKEVLK
jgi:hypothetical protein